MSTDLAVIEAALKAATPGPWEASGHDSGHSMYELDWYVVQPEAGDAICDLESYERVTCNERHAQTTAEADAHLIANAPAWLAELLERVKAAEAHVVELARDAGEQRAMYLDAHAAGLKMTERAHVAEATIARVRALAEEHPGTAWNSGLNLRQALRDALGGTPTDATDGASSADDERNRFSGEDTDEPTQPILRPTDQRYEPPADDHESGCCR